MGESSSDFRDTLVELIDTSPQPVDHPSPDQWIAYHRGELTEEEAGLQEHLARCRDCFDLAAAAAAFAQPDAEPGAGQEVETAALWRLLRPQLAPPPSNVREIAAGPRRRPSWRFRLPPAVAASFFVALVGLTAWNLYLRSALEARRAPRPNVPIFYLSGGERRLTPASAETTLSGPGPWLVILPADELPVYRAALRDATTGRALGSYELRPNQNLDLTIQLPAGFPPGHYRLELADGSGGQAGRVLQTQPLRVAGPGGGA